MKPNIFSDVEDFDDGEDNRKFKFGSKINGKEILENEKETLLISYEYVDLNVTDYCIDQPCLDGEDAFNYFATLKYFSSLTIRELSNLHHTYHFHIYQKANSTLISLVEQISGVNFKPETLPLIGQFALYTLENASRKTNVKSPRIYFIIGKRAVMHILFYDPYHEINPGKPE